MSPDSWQRVRLEELVTVKHGFAFPGKHIHDQPVGDILLTPGNFAIGGGFRQDSFKYYDGPVPEGFVLTPGDLLVTMTDLSKTSDTLGFPAVVPSSDGQRYLHNQRLGKIEVESAALDSAYLYYRLRAHDYRHEVLASATGTTVKHTSPSRIARFAFDLPPIHEQRSIAALLGALDDKIELNRRMNETLERTIDVLFGQLLSASIGEPDVPIYDLAEVVYGAAFASAQFNGDGHGRPLIRIRDLASHEPDVFTDEAHPRATVIRPGDIVVGMDGEFRAHIWRGRNAFLNQRVCTFVPGPAVPRAYVLKVIEAPLAFFERAKTGTTVIHLGKADIDRFRVRKPRRDALAEFGQATDPMVERIVGNAAESRTLAALRDALLPKLISGELRIHDAERATEQPT